MLYLAPRTSTVMNSPKPYHINTGKAFFDCRLYITFCLVINFLANRTRTGQLSPPPPILGADGRFPPEPLLEEMLCSKQLTAAPTQLQLCVSKLLSAT